MDLRFLCNDLSILDQQHSFEFEVYEVPLKACSCELSSDTSKAVVPSL